MRRLDVGFFDCNVVNIMHRVVTFWAFGGRHSIKALINDQVEFMMVIHEICNRAQRLCVGLDS